VLTTSIATCTRARLWLLVLVTLPAVLVGCGGSGGGGATGVESSAADTLKTAQAAAEKMAARLGITTASTNDQGAAVRLADQASFGPTEALVADIRAQGIENWISAQFSASGSRYTSGEGDAIHKNDNGDFCLNKDESCWVEWFSSQPLLRDFYRNALSQPDQLRQRVAFALSQIAVISNVEVDGTYGLRNYHNMLLENAFGNYREVLRRVTLSPVMGNYLDHVNNDKLNPNENYARELLQLFAVGTCLLNADGSLQSGSCQPTYNNEIVRDYAFALTGWTYPAGGSTTWGCWPENTNCHYYGGDMEARAVLHDNKARTLLGSRGVPASRTPQQALDAVLDSLMAHQNTAPFIGRQLIQHLVKSNPSGDYVLRVSNAFRTGKYASGERNFGSGVNGDLTATIAAVLLDSEARNSTSALPAEKMREPAIAMAGMLRAMNGKTDGEALGWWWGDALRQHVFRAGSVFNFYPPDFPVANTTLQGPAFGVFNPNTAVAMVNFANQMIMWGGAQPNTSLPGAIGTSVDLKPFEADAADAAKLTDRFISLVIAGRLSSSSRQRIIDAVSAWNATEHPNDWKIERVRTVAYLVLTSPTYLVLN
jgi:uncharacterized protein (DUF1800 family)